MSGRPLRQHVERLAAVAVRVTTTRPSTGMRMLVADRGHEPRGERIVRDGRRPRTRTSTAGLSVISVHVDRRRSSGRCRCGAGTTPRRARRRSAPTGAGPGSTGSHARSGGMNAARMPEATVHVAPRVVGAPRPAARDADEHGAAARGSTLTEWMPGVVVAAAEPLGSAGLVPEAATSSHESPRSAERKSPPGIVPAHSSPGSSACAGLDRPHHLRGPRRGRRRLRRGPGWAGTGRGDLGELAPPASRRWTLLPKCPWSSTA